VQEEPEFVRTDNENDWTYPPCSNFGGSSIIPDSPGDVTDNLHIGNEKNRTLNVSLQFGGLIGSFDSSLSKSEGISFRFSPHR
jgi:hypothetical protein